jgi:signal transduction histidine kinase
MQPDEDRHLLGADEVARLRARIAVLEQEVAGLHAGSDNRMPPSFEQRVQERTADLLTVNAALAREVAERRQMEQALRFLAEASIILTSSLDYMAQLDSLTHLIVPFLADWCVIDMLHADGMIYRLASAHVDPARAALVQQLRTRYPILSHDAEHTLVRVLRTGRSWLDPAVMPERLLAEARDAAHGTLMQTLGFQAEMVVPLVTRGRVLGTITCVVGEGTRRYGAADLALAEELARRAALAIDNARLYQEARAIQDALQQAHTVLEQRVAERTAALAAANAALRSEIAERQRVAEERRRLEHEAQRAQHFALLGRLAAGVSHEIRNPLGAIFLHVDLLEEELYRPSPDSAEQIAQSLVDIKTHLARLEDLVQDYLSLVRVAHLERTPQDLGAAVQTWLAEWHGLALTQGVVIALDGLDDLGQVAFHASTLQRVLLNLVQNALDAMPHGGTLTLAGQSTATQVQLDVRDTGSGIPAERLAQLFEPLYTTKPGGTGLGLYIVHEIMAAHGGQVTVQSVAGQGTTFTLTLPRSVAAVAS